jgi:hypothetical protein
MNTELEKLREALALMPYQPDDSIDFKDALAEAIASANRDRGFTYFVSLDVESRYALIGYRSRDAEVKALESKVHGAEVDIAVSERTIAVLQAEKVKLIKLLARTYNYTDGVDPDVEALLAKHGKEPSQC